MSDHRIHIVHVIHHLFIGGMENGLVNLINRMPQDRFQHTVVCVEDFSDFRDRIAIDGVEVIPLYRSKIGVWAMRRALFSLFRALRPDIVHSRNMSGLDAVIPARLAGVKCCLHGEHGRDVDDLQGTRFKYKLLRWLHSPFIQHYITVSDELRRYLIDDIGIRPAKVTQIINGVDVDKFKVLPSKNTRIGDELNVPKALVAANKVVIGAVGRLQKVKNYGLLIRAFAQLKQQEHLRDNVSLLLVGDGPERENLTALAHELGVDNEVFFAGASSNVAAYLQLMDVFVLSSLVEGISNTILEAMAASLPVVATAVGGSVELVRDGQTGYLVQSDDVEAMTQALLSICSDTELRQTLARQSRQRVVSELSLKVMVKRYQDIYTQSLGL